MKTSCIGGAEWCESRRGEMPPLWSRGVARWFRWCLSVADPFVWRCITSSAMLRFHIPLVNRTGLFQASGSREDSHNRRSHLHVTLPASSENKIGVLRLIAISRSFIASCVRRQLRPLPSTGITGFIGITSLSAIPVGPAFLSRAAS